MGKGRGVYPKKRDARLERFEGFFPKNGTLGWKDSVVLWGRKEPKLPVKALSGGKTYLMRKYCCASLICINDSVLFLAFRGWIDGCVQKSLASIHTCT